VLAEALVEPVLEATYSRYEPKTYEPEPSVRIIDPWISFSVR
jgi:hypothetical protein